MNTEQEWRKVNNRQKAYANKWSRIWNAYYIEQGKKLINFETAFSYESVEALFVRMYQDIGVAFAAFEFRNVKESHNDIQTKNRTIEPRNYTSWQQHMANYARMNAAKSISSITLTGLEKGKQIIQELTAQGLEMGLDSNELSRYIDDNLPLEWRLPAKFNALRIARTETISAANEGAYRGALDTGLDLVKIWLTTMDGRERESHAATNGQRREMNEAFTLGDGVNISKPGAKGAPPEDVINCRCAVAYRSKAFDN